MVQLGIRRKDGAVARLPHAQAKVCVLKTDGKFLVIASDLLKYVASDHLTGARYDAKVARTHGAGKIALALCREILVGMGKSATHATQNAGVLHQMIGKAELGTHHARIGTLQIAHHLFDKVRAYDLGIVVQQQVVALGVLHAKVDDLGVIKLARPVHNARDALAFGCCSHALRQGFVIRKRLRGFAVVLHQDDLVVGIRCLLGDRHHAGVERLNVILGGNHNAHQRRRLRQRIAHAVDKRRPGLLDRSANAHEAKRLAKWTGRYDVIQGSRLDFDGGAFFWQYQHILSLGIPNPIAKWDLGPEGYRPMNQLCFEGGLFSRRVVDKIGLPDARFFIYGDDACYGYVASQHFPAAVVADVVLKRARAVSNWDIAGKRQLSSTSDTNRYYIMRNRGFLARYMQNYGDYRPILFRLGNAATFCKEFIRLAAVDKCFKTGIPALRRGMKDARKIIKDPDWKPMPPLKDGE